MRKVLDVGQCNPDHSRISRVLKQNFGVEIERAHSHDEAVQMARDAAFDLILINRLLDADGSEGMAILKTLKQDPATAELPVMIVSNFEDAQAAAVQAGAVPGFGKANLETPESIGLLTPFLQS